MEARGLLTHCLDRHNDSQPGVGAVIIAALFQRANHFACFRDRLFTIALDMEVCGAQNIEIRDHRDQAVIAFGWCLTAGTANHSFSFDHRRRPDTLRTAIATAFFWPTSTTNSFPRVTPV
jgi:hypothetical protein